MNSKLLVLGFFHLHSDCYDMGEGQISIVESDQIVETCLDYFQNIKEINKFCLYPVIFNV